MVPVVAICLSKQHSRKALPQHVCYTQINRKDRQSQNGWCQKISAHIGYQIFCKEILVAQITQLPALCQEVNL